MPRVALVTGGTRGIGAAISKALKAAGYTVAADLSGNDEAAQKFKAETGITVYKWDVASFEACAAGVKQVEAELGPVDVLVNNAGITRDAQLHRMKPEQWTAVINTNLGSLFNMTRQVIEGMRDAQVRPHRQHLLDQRPEGPVRPDQLFGRQGRRDRLHQGAGAGGRASSASPSTPSARAISTPRWCRRCRKEVLEKSDPADHPDRPPRRAGRDRPLRGVPGRRRRRLHHRLDADGQRRAVFRVTFRLGAFPAGGLAGDEVRPNVGDLRPGSFAQSANGISGMS